MAKYIASHQHEQNSSTTAKPNPATDFLSALEPNFNESKQADIIALNVVMLVAASLALGLRFWSNYLSPSHRFGYDDFFALITLVS